MPWPVIDKVRSWVVQKKVLVTGLVGVLADGGAALVELGVGIPGVGIPVKLVGELLKYGVDRLGKADVDLPGLKPAGQVFTTEQFDAINDWLAKLTGAYAGILEELEARNTATGNESADEIIAIVKRSLAENAQLRQQFNTALREIQGLKLTLVSIKRTVEETHENVLDLRAEMQRLIGLSAAGAEEARRLTEMVMALLAQVGMQSGALRDKDSLAIGGEDERTLVKALLVRFRALPADRQKELPALLNGLGKLQVGAGEYATARQIFVELTATSDTAATGAEASYNAYRAALEERDWDKALAALLTAVELDEARFAPFPLHRYHPIRILGAGGFGTAFLCRDEHFGEEVVVKSLHGGELDRGVKDVFREAQVLRQLSHPWIIRVRDCEYADPIHRARPYIVMDYFPGLTLEEFVTQRGPLSPSDLAAVGQGIASAMQAVHARGVLHRDLKPGNILLRKEGGRWLGKVIDFGLAMRRQDVETSIVVASRGKTIVSESAVGSRDYAPPEQMGKLPGVRPGTYSDVFAFGKTCCYALFKLTEPRTRHWSSIPRDLMELLERCMESELDHRCGDFEPVLKVLKSLDPTRAEGLAKLRTLLRTILERNQGKVTKEDNAVVAEHCKRHRLTTEDAKTLFAEVRKAWEDELPLVEEVATPAKEFVNALDMKFAFIPPCPDGFLMGSPESEPERSADETQHRVVLTRGYYLGVHQVTRGQFARFVKATGYKTEAETSGGAYGWTGSKWEKDPKFNWRSPGFAQTDDHPVVCVSWNDAAAMCAWLTKQDGQGRRYELPSEAQWEYACRAGTKTPFHFGSKLNGDLANCDGNYPYGTEVKGNYHKATKPVGSYPANPWGLYDMHGNVWEWCADYYGPYEGLEEENPKRETMCDNKDLRVLRGGSWINVLARRCRSASRDGSEPANRNGNVGFRVCLPLD